MHSEKPCDHNDHDHDADYIKDIHGSRSDLNMDLNIHYASRKQLDRRESAPRRLCHLFNVASVY